MLTVLKENAASCSRYIRMGDLTPGRYEIRKFSLRDSMYGRRLVIDINKGYIYLPEKMLEQFNTEKKVDKLNKDRYDLVYSGKDENAPQRLKFTFEMHSALLDDDDDNDDEDVVVDHDHNRNRKQNSKKQTKKTASAKKLAKNNRKDDNHDGDDDDDNDTGYNDVDDDNDEDDDNVEDVDDFEASSFKGFGRNTLETAADALNAIMENHFGNKKPQPRMPPPPPPACTAASSTSSTSSSAKAAKAAKK